jgi:hypothetical protein
MIAPVRTSTRKSSVTIKATTKTNADNDTIVGNVATNDMDTMADTCCAGPNWTVIEYTGHTCDVYPFKEDVGVVKDVPVATCATLMEGEDGNDFIIIAHEMLVFGRQMDRSLLNQNQIRPYIRHRGGRVQDDYTRVDEEFGINTGDAFIPFLMRGATVYFESRSPTRDEIESLPHVVITSKQPWDPDAKPLRVSNARTTRARVTSTRDEHETDVILGSVSPILDENVLRTRMIASIRISNNHEYGLDPTAATCGDEIRDATSSDTRVTGAAYSSTRHSRVTPENLSRLWKVGLETAQKTLRATTQDGIRTALHPITRRYRVDHLHLHRRRLNTAFYTDTLFSRVASLRGNKCAQVFTDGQFTAVYPIVSKSRAGESLRQLSHDVGTPDHLTADLAGEQTGSNTEFMRQVEHLDIAMHWAEKGRKNQNALVENEIGILKRRWKSRMADKSVPSRLWDYGLVYEGEIMSRVCRSGHDRSGYERLTGNTPDISEWLDFGFYDLIWYHVATNEPTVSPRQLGRWLGISHHVGSDLCYWVLTRSGKVLSTTTLQHVTRQDTDDTTISQQVIAFDLAVNARLDDAAFTLTDASHDSPYIQDDYSPSLPHPRQGIVPSDEEYGDMLVDCEEPPEDDDAEDLDNFIHANLLLDAGNGEKISGRVIKRSTNMDGSKKGTPHKNPMFDTRAYLIEFKNGSVDEYTANVIAENIYSQVDDEGRNFSLLKEIGDHRKDDKVALAKEESYTISANGNHVPKRTTKGWQLQIEWKDGTTEWTSLKRLKDSNPVETAEYAVANQLQNEPAFSWWIGNVLRHRKRIISKVKNKYWRTAHKFGIRLPKTAEEALRIDEETGTDFWRKAIEKELRKVKVAWEARDDLDIEQVRRGRQLIGFTEIACHMIFDVKMDFTRKARFVAGGHMTDTPSSITYSSVVSRDSVRLAFLIAELNGLDVMACDIGNAYLNAPCREKVWFKGGIETGEDKGKVLVITRALYGLKSSGASWRSTLVTTLRGLGFEETYADPDTWRRKATRNDGTEYYELLLVYVDDILLVSHDPGTTLRVIGTYYELKEGSLGPPDTYLGAQVYQHNLPDGRKA